MGGEVEAQVGASGSGITIEEISDSSARAAPARAASVKSPEVAAQPAPTSTPSGTAAPQLSAVSLSTPALAPGLPETPVLSDISLENDSENNATAANEDAFGTELQTSFAKFDKKITGRSRRRHTMSAGRRARKSIDAE